jgi:hypothetical protein
MIEEGGSYEGTDSVYRTQDNLDTLTDEDILNSYSINNPSGGNPYLKNRRKTNEDAVNGMNEELVDYEAGLDDDYDPELRESYTTSPYKENIKPLGAIIKPSLPKDLPSDVDYGEDDDDMTDKGWYSYIVYNIQKTLSSVFPSHYCSAGKVNKRSPPFAWCYKNVLIIICLFILIHNINIESLVRRILPALLNNRNAYLSFYGIRGLLFAILFILIQFLVYYYNL